MQNCLLQSLHVLALYGAFRFPGWSLPELSEPAFDSSAATRGVRGGYRGDESGTERGSELSCAEELPLPGLVEEGGGASRAIM